MPKIMYTIGHSEQKREFVINTLINLNIRSVIDVRPIPMARINPLFNREYLEPQLKKCAMEYAHFGKELEGIIKGKSINEVAHSSIFLRGLKRIEEFMDLGNVCLLGLSNHPVYCIRFSLISRNLLTLLGDNLHIEHLIYKKDEGYYPHYEHNYILKVRYPNLSKDDAYLEIEKLVKR